MPLLTTVTSPSSPSRSRSTAILLGPPGFSISPAIGGFTTWIFSDRGNLDITTPNEYTLTPLNSFYLNVDLYGAGGVSAYSSGGPGGRSTGRVLFQRGLSFKLIVGSSGAGDGWTAGPYGGAGSGWFIGISGSGGGYTGLFLTSVLQSNSIIIAGGGGGGHGVDNAAYNGDGGAGGGISGNAGGGTASGAGGTQTTGAAPLQGGQGGIRNVNEGSGGGGGGGYWGGFGGAAGRFAGGQAGAPGGGGSGYINGHPNAPVSGATTTAGSGRGANQTGRAILSAS